MPLKLIYADARGKAETARMLFALGGKEFEDVRQTPEEWQKIKESTPYLERPILVYENGKMLSQSRAIERYLAKLFDLYGSNPEQQADVDMFIDCLNDIEGSIMEVYKAREDAAKKEEIIKNFLEEKGPQKFKKLAAMFASEGSFYLGEKISWADVALVSTFSFFTMLGINIDGIMEPKLRAAMDKVEEHPKIKEWVAKRPKTDH